MEIAEVLNKTAIALQEAGGHYERKTLEELFDLNGRDMKLKPVELSTGEKISVSIRRYNGGDDWHVSASLDS